MWWENPLVILGILSGVTALLWRLSSAVNTEKEDNIIDEEKKRREELAKEAAKAASEAEAANETISDTEAALAKIEAEIEAIDNKPSEITNEDVKNPEAVKEYLESEGFEVEEIFPES